MLSFAGADVGVDVDVNEEVIVAETLESEDAESETGRDDVGVAVA